MSELTVSDAATLLSLSPATVRQLAGCGIVRPCSSRGDLRFERRDLVRWAANWGEKLTASARQALI